jgi:hypothetical protein
LVCNHGISQAKGMQFISSVMHCQTIPASQQHTFTIGPSGIDLQDGSSPQPSGATCTKGWRVQHSSRKARLIKQISD